VRRYLRAPTYLLGNEVNRKRKTFKHSRLGVMSKSKALLLPLMI
jgi:hypothetical protein